MPLSWKQALIGIAATLAVGGLSMVLTAGLERWGTACLLLGLACLIVAYAPDLWRLVTHQSATDLRVTAPLRLLSSRALPWRPQQGIPYAFEAVLQAKRPVKPVKLRFICDESVLSSTFVLERVEHQELTALYQFSPIPASDRELLVLFAEPTITPDFTIRMEVRSAKPICITAVRSVRGGPAPTATAYDGMPGILAGRKLLETLQAPR